ncbi:hypothetical protein HN51_038454 [Arachis hypogaea]|nr:Protein PLASTID TRANSCRIPTIONALLY ACTIVE [Arachis hypogaea]
MLHRWRLSALHNRRTELPSHRNSVAPPLDFSSCVGRVVVSNPNVQKLLCFDLASTVQVILISSTPLSLFLFAATLTLASPLVRNFSSSFSASRPIHCRSSHFAALCHCSSPASEAFNMLSPSYREKKMEELEMDEDEFFEEQFEIKGEILEPIEILWAGPMVVRLPLQDWPLRGWEVDRDEVAFMREAYKMLVRRVSLEQLEGGGIVDEDYDTGGLALDRYKVFLKQYKE